VSKYSHLVANALTSDGHKVIVIAQLGAARQPDARYDQVEVWSPGFSSFLSIAKFVERMRAKHIIVQHEFFMYGKLRANLSFLIFLLQSRRLGASVVTTMYHAMTRSELEEILVGGEYTGSSLIPLFVGVVRLFNMLVAVLGTRALVCHAASVSAFPKFVRRRVSVIPLIAPTGSARTSAAEIARVKDSYNLGDDYALSFGFLSRYKGIELIVEAAEAIGNSRRFVIVSGKNVRQADKTQYLTYYYGLKRRAEAAGILWIDYVPEADVEPIFAGAGLLVLPYVSFHGSSGPLSTGATLGVPTLVTRVMRIDEFASVSIPSTGAGVALGVTKFFSDESYSLAVRRAGEKYLETRSGRAVSAAYSRALFQ
jgi:glycosyltransferase involved in cell wall biosynthesis